MNYAFTFSCSLDTRSNTHKILVITDFNSQLMSFIDKLYCMYSVEEEISS